MEFVKEEMRKNVWVLMIGGKKIPLEAISALIKSVALSVLIVLAYNIGGYNASEYLKWNSYFHGNFNPATHTYQTCWVEAGGLSVHWQCENNSIQMPGFYVPMQNATIK